ncbi:MAG: hypothetical protein JRN54_03085 [Nitrososphaerota archaeon]|jgi:hypothetical protein|nr:hypothetical protein [Nitrososphaerota archaeon]
MAENSPRPSPDPEEFGERLKKVMEEVLQVVGGEYGKELKVPTSVETEHQFKGFGTGCQVSWRTRSLPFFGEDLDFGQGPFGLTELHSFGELSDFLRRSLPGLTVPDDQRLSLKQAKILVTQGILAVHRGVSLGDFVAAETTNYQKASTIPLNELSVSAPVEAFDCESEGPIDLGNGLVLRKLASEERTQLADPVIAPRSDQVPLSVERIKWIQWTLEGKAQLQPWQGERFYIPRPIFDSRLFYQVIHALRLFKKGWVSLAGMRVWREPWRARLSWDGFVDSPRRADPTWSPLTLTSSELADFLTFYSKYPHQSKSGTFGDLSTAISRFNDTYSHDEREEKLVDAIICLESLLLRGSRGEQSFRLAVRGAVLLAGPLGGRRGIYTMLKKAVGERNDLVHGGTPSGETSVPDLIELARLALRRFTDPPQAWSSKYFFELVDEYAVTNPGIPLEEFLEHMSDLRARNEEAKRKSPAIH